LGLQVAEVADGSGGTSLGGQGQGFRADGAGPVWLALSGVDAGEQGQVEGSAADVSVVHAQRSGGEAFGLGVAAEGEEAVAELGRQVCLVEVAEPVRVGAAVRSDMAAPLV
jgi:hypothetical protein